MAWRYLLAFALSLAILILSQVLFPPAPRPAAPPPPPAAAPPPAPGPVAPVASGEKPNEQRPVRQHVEEKTVKSGDTIDYDADSRGGRVAYLRLPEEHEAVDVKEPYLLLASPKEGAGTLGFMIEHPKTGEPLIPWDEDWTLVSVTAAEGGPGVSLENEVDGIRIKKSILPGAASDIPEVRPEGFPARHLKVRIELRNTSKEEKTLNYRIYGPTGIDTEDASNPGTDIALACWTFKGGGKVLGTGSLSGGTWERFDGVAWVGASNNYFASILFPLPVGAPFVEKAFATTYPDEGSMEKVARSKFGRAAADLPPADLETVRTKAYKNLRVGMRSVKLTLKPDETKVHEYALYAGPRTPSDLNWYGSALNLAAVNDYGALDFLVKFFMRVLDVLNFAGWGMAIILLTFLVKLGLHPINKRSQASMQRFQKKLQKIKPEMDALKERYGDNRMKMNQEMQKLWRQHGINPGAQMAGCLIIFLQIPIWWGLYSTLRHEPGLRQAPFLFIRDLTRPDMLFSFGLNVPFLGPYFNLLPLLYVILTVVNQRLQPRPQDPQMLTQYRMMTFMLVFFGFLFYQFASGFLLYFLTSAFLGIIESKIIKAELAHDDRVEGAVVARASAGAGGTMYPGRPKKSDDEPRGKRRR